jgi:hypothetical protein
MSNGDKLTEELPRVRVCEQMASELMKEAAARDISLSELIRMYLTRSLYGDRVRRTPDED